MVSIRQIPRLLVWPVLSGLLLAGCTSTANDGQAGDEPFDTARLGLEAFGQSVPDAMPIPFAGSLQGAIASQPHHMVPVVPDWTCHPGQCLEFPIDLDIPPGWWADHDGALEISIVLNRTDVTFDDERSYHLRVMQGDRVVAEALNQFYATTLLMDEPESGAYTGLVFAATGAGPFKGIVQVQSHTPYAALEELPPDLIVLLPTEFTFDTPACVGAAWLACIESAPGGSEGCFPDERSEGAERCLRFAMMTANVGKGPLDMRLDVSQTADALFAQADWIQHIHRGDGTAREEVVATGIFEPHHAHMHLDGFVEYRFYSYDLATHQRGEQVGEGAKVGFCFGDFGLAHLGLGHTAPPTALATDSFRHCTVPEDNEMRLYLSSNWYDVYNRELTYQYVEVGGVPDGVYELVVTVNPQAAAIEADPLNNEASAVLRLDGDEITVLHRWSQGLCELGGDCAP